MSTKKLYALTDEHVEVLKAWADYGLSISTDHKELDETADAFHALTPIDADDAIERMCKAFYEAGTDKLDDTIRPQWDNLARFSPDIAQVYRERVSAALAALLGGGQA